MSSNDAFIRSNRTSLNQSNKSNFKYLYIQDPMAASTYATLERKCRKNKIIE